MAEFYEGKQFFHLDDFCATDSFKGTAKASSVADIIINPKNKLHAKTIFEQIHTHRFIILHSKD